MKSRKNETEIRNIEKAFLQDSIAMCYFLSWYFPFFYFHAWLFDFRTINFCKVKLDRFNRFATIMLFDDISYTW